MSSDDLQNVPIMQCKKTNTAFNYYFANEDQALTFISADFQQTRFLHEAGSDGRPAVEHASRDWACKQ